MSNGRKKRVTHRDVARRANVSTAVVSYVINNGPRHTSPEARERVLSAIRELGYHPNAFARSLRAQRSHTVGFVAYDVEPLEMFMSPYSAGILTGLTAELQQRDHYMLIYPQVLGKETAPLERLLRSARLDGVVVRLIQDPPASDALMETIAATGVPCVCIERGCAERFGIAAVTYDDTHGALLATRYLVEQGHRRIAHLSGDMHFATAKARLDGYRQALSEAGIGFDERLVRGATWETENAGTSVAELLALPEPPTAIFAANDNLALVALEMLRRRGLELPRDMAVIGFDDIEGAAQSTPALTTVRIPLVELGRRAADLVLDAAEGQDIASLSLPLELIRRGTA